MYCLSVRNVSGTLMGMALMIAAASPLQAQDTAREGWVVLPTQHNYSTLVTRVDDAAKAHKLGVVTRASATVGAKKALKKDIPGNMVVGLYHPRFAVPMLEASVAAGIEAPIRIYITENADGSTTLSYKTPSHVFSPYMDEGGEKLRKLASELDTIFAALAKQAASE